MTHYTSGQSGSLNSFASFHIFRCARHIRQRTIGDGFRGIFRAMCTSFALILEKRFAN